MVASKMTVTDPLSSCTCSSGDVVGRFAGLILCLVVGCHEGSAHEPGTPCDEGSRCRFPLTCIEGRCELVDAAIADSDTAADREQTADGTADARDRDDTSDGTADISEAQDRASETGDAADAGDAIDTAEEEAGTGDAAANNDAAGVPEPDRPPSMIVLASTDNGGIWLLDVPLDSINGPVPGAMRVIDVAAAAGPIGFVDDVEAQATGQVVHVLARTGASVHATSVAGLTWAPWEHVADQVSAFGLANVGGQPWACLIGGDGHLRLASRQPSGTWQDWGDVTAETSWPAAQGEAPAELTKLDCAGFGDDLEIFALDGSGHLWEAVKKPTGWSRFKRLSNAASLVLSDIDVSNGAGDLQALGSDASDQYHAVRSGGIWTDFGSVEQASGSDPMGQILAGAMTAILLEVEWVQANNRGEIWFCSRYRTGTQWFVLLSDASPDDHRFVAASATSVLPY